MKRRRSALKRRYGRARMPRPYESFASVASGREVFVRNVTQDGTVFFTLVPDGAHGHMLAREFARLYRRVAKRIR
jgi:hypothetical protein